MTSLLVVRDDITTLAVDAIVNAANSRLAGGSGVDGAIHRAGGPTIAAQCRVWVSEHGTLPTGEAMVTDGGDLPCRFVIHTVGPVWGQREHNESQRLLKKCYSASLDLAAANGCQSVAFPAISTGAYGYPKQEAAGVAVASVRDWCESHDDLERVVFVCFGDENHQIYESLLDS